MPVKTEREYRSMNMMEIRECGDKEKREMIVEGYATTFNDPYVMYEWYDTEYFEQIDARAFDGADMTDCLFQYDHSGRVMARTKNGSLQLNVDNHGLHVRADLSQSDAGRELYEEIKAGLVREMSFAFTVSEDMYNKDTHTRTITKIKKVYDVSAVSIPANPSTDISARSYFNGVIEEERKEIAEQAEKRKRIMKLKLMLED